MTKTLIGSQLRQLRRLHRQTQADMAQRLGISPAYVNLLENNQRSLSVQVLMALTEAYGVDWRDLVRDTDAGQLADLRTAARDPMFPGDPPDLWPNHVHQGAGLTTFAFAVSGHDVVVTTDAECAVCWTFVAAY